MRDKKEKDLIFECRKCEHNLYVSLDKIRKLLKTDCPNCGEESFGIWLLIGEGIFKEVKIR
jgi:transcription elongation factor Elf1